MDPTCRSPSRGFRLLAQAGPDVLALAKARAALIAFIIFGIFSAIVTVLWYGTTLLLDGKLRSGDFFSFTIYTVFIGGSLGSFADLYSNLQKSIGATQRRLPSVRANIALAKYWGKSDKQLNLPAVPSISRFLAPPSECASSTSIPSMSNTASCKFSRRRAAISVTPNMVRHSARPSTTGSSPNGPAWSRGCADRSW